MMVLAGVEKWKRVFKMFFIFRRELLQKTSMKNAFLSLASWLAPPSALCLSVHILHSMVLYFPIKQFSPRFGDDFFTFEIKAFEVIHSDSCCGFASYVIYTIDLQRGKRKWRMKYRFSKFEELHKHLLVTTSIVPIDLPKLPSKTYFPVTADQDFLEKRMKELSVYLDALLKRLSEEGDLENTCAAEFLNLNGNNEEMPDIEPRCT
jgi:hypothetical protein